MRNSDEYRRKQEIKDEFIFWALLLGVFLFGFVVGMLVSTFVLNGGLS